MKHALKALVIVFFSIFFLGIAKANSLPDLEGAELRDQGTCIYKNQQFPCAVYEKNGVKYVVYANNSGIILIYRVKTNATTPYDESDMELIWSKNAKWASV